MRKIYIYIDNLYRGGAQRVVINIANYLAEKGNQITIINDFLPEKNQFQYVPSNNVKRIYLRKELTGNVLVKNIERIAHLRQIIKINNPDVVVSFKGMANIRMLLATIGLKVKKIVSVRNIPEMEYGKSLQRRLITNIIFMLTDICVVQTPYVKEYFINSVRKKCVIILNPVDKKFFNVLASYELQSVLAVGRLEDQKDYDTLLQSFKKIIKKYKEAVLYICGEGSKREYIEQLIEDNENQGHIVLLGDCNEVERIMMKCSIYVLTSLYEGLPNSLMEAMAAGMACITTDSKGGGAKFLIGNPPSGIICECKNVKQVYEALDSLLSSVSYRKQMGENAKIRAQLFFPKTINEEWEKVIVGN